MATPGAGHGRVPVRISPSVWSDEVERLDRRSAGRAAAERERPRLETLGVAIGEVLRCVDPGPDGTRLAGQFKLYVPIAAAPASQRPFGFVLSPRTDEHGLYFVVLAFGERHPRRGTRSVYERAHKRLHGRYPDQ